MITSPLILTLFMVGLWALAVWAVIDAWVDRWFRWRDRRYQPPVGHPFYGDDE